MGGMALVRGDTALHFLSAKKRKRSNCFFSYFLVKSREGIYTVFTSPFISRWGWLLWFVRRRALHW